MRSFLLISIKLFILQGLCAANKYNITYRDLEDCREYDSKSGYGYQVFFRIDELKHVQSNDGDVLNINLFVLAAKDAHILLSTVEKPDKNTPVYEIVLGAGGNTFAEIRRRRQSSPIRTVRVKDVLSAIDPLPLNIRITQQGRISASINGLNKVIINATVQGPLPIQYISFSGWGTTEAKWFFDCKNSTGDALEEVIPELSAEAKLIATLFNGYDPFAIPQNLKQVFINFTLQQIAFEPKLSIMRSRGIFRMNWVDKNLRWSPKLFENITEIRRHTANLLPHIWFPDLVLLNGQSEYFKELLLEYSIKLTSNGVIFIESRETTFDTWCTGATQNWPQDEADCEILLSLAHNLNITLSQLAVHNMADNFEMLKRVESFATGENEWLVTGANFVSVITSAGRSNDYEDIASYVTNNHLVYNLTLKRNTSLYKNVLYAPLFVVVVLILLSFWTERYVRATMNLIALYITFGIFVCLADTAPNLYVPTIVICYDYALLLGILSIIFFIINCWLKECPSSSNALTKMLQFSWLPLSSSIDYKEVRETNTSDIRVLIDRLAFTVLALAVAITLVFVM